MVEHLVYTEEVVGSSPTSPIIVIVSKRLARAINNNEVCSMLFMTSKLVAKPIQILQRTNKLRER